MNAETTPGVCEGQSTCHMRVRGYGASVVRRVWRLGFIGNALKMAVYLRVCVAALRLLSPAWVVSMHTLCQSEVETRCTKVRLGLQPQIVGDGDGGAKVHTCWPMRVVGNRQADGSVRGMCCSGGYDLRVQVEYLTL